MEQALYKPQTSYKSIWKSTYPMMLMMIVISVYGIIDGIFVSNFVGKAQFAALNLIMPFVFILGVFGFMVGTGGTALISKTFGEGDQEKAKKYFTQFVIVTIIAGVILGSISEIFLPQIAELMGAKGEDNTYAVQYGRILCGSVTFLMLQYSFQSFLAAAGRPKMAFILSLAAGVGNLLGDFLFVYVFKWGLYGAAAATLLSWLVGSIIPLIYFAKPNKTPLHYVKTKLELKPIIKALYNGLSEMVANISFNLAAIIYNHQLLNLYGNNGVIAYGVIMYVGFIFAGCLSGYEIGLNPLIAYQYGAKNPKEISVILRKSVVIVTGLNVMLFVASFFLAKPAAMIFTNYDAELLELTTRALRIYSFVFIISGYSVLASGLFTSLNNGTISALVSLLRALVFQVPLIYLVPFLFGKEWIWASSIFSEALSLIASFIIVILYQKKYRYQLFGKILAE